MEKPTVYVETSVISYLAADPSRDPVTARNQRITHAWWARRGEFDLVSSWIAVQEARRGNLLVAIRRLHLVAGLRLLPTGEDVPPLAEALANGIPLPACAREDAAHIAVAAVYGIDYLVTWDRKHIANPRLREAMVRICASRGVTAPTPCTPEALISGL